MAKTVVIVGALDTKAEDFRYVKELIEAAGLATVLVDFGVIGEPGLAPDVSRAEVAAAAGADLARLASGDHKDEAMRAMAAGLTVVVGRLHDEGRVDGILGMGGSGGTSIATSAMRALPVGRPQGDGLDDGRRRRERLRRHEGHHLHAVGRRRRRPQPDQPRDLRERGRRDRRDGGDGGAGRGRGPAARRRLDVRQHDEGGRPRQGDRGGSGLRGPRLPRHGYRRPDDGGPDRRRLRRGQPGHHDDRARRRDLRRRPERGPGPLHGRVAGRHPRGPRPRLRRHGELRRRRDGAGATTAIATSTSGTRTSRSCAPTSTRTAGSAS